MELHKNEFALPILLAGFVTGCVIGATLSKVMFFRRTRGNKRPAVAPHLSGTDNEGSSSSSWEEEDEESNEEDLRLKMVFAIRQRTPKMPPALVAKLVARAAVQLVLTHVESQSTPTSDQWRRWYWKWRRDGCAKITLKVDDKEELLQEMESKANALQLPVHTVSYSAVTAGEADGYALPGSGIALIALGPAPADNLDPITGKLKLLS